MTNNEAKQFYKGLKKYWGDELVHFEHYPRKFAWQVKVYKFKRDLR